MAIARDILSGLFGATAGGLRGYAVQQAEERERMQRQQEIEAAREFERELTAEARRYQEGLEARRGVAAGELIPVADTATPRSTSQRLEGLLTGAGAEDTALGMARGATGPSPLGGRGPAGGFTLPDAELSADYVPAEVTRPERQVIELAGKQYEVPTAAETRGRELEAARGGRDAIEIDRLKQLARSSEASEERESARALLSDLDISYKTPEELSAQEFDIRDERIRREEERLIATGFSPREARFIARGLQPRETQEEGFQGVVAEKVAEYATTPISTGYGQQTRYPTKEEIDEFRSQLETLNPYRDRVSDALGPLSDSYRPVQDRGGFNPYQFDYNPRRRPSETTGSQNAGTMAYDDELLGDG